MAKHEKEFNMEEFKEKYDKILKEGMETAQAFGKVAGDKLDPYFKKIKKGAKNIAKKTSEKVKEVKEEIHEVKAGIHEENKEKAERKILEDANALMELSREAAEQAQIKFLEYAEIQKTKQEGVEEEIFDDDDDDESN